ncbi:hypothetical protein BaRGS_00013633, partial [Batillaria attramentaria]
VTGQALWTQKPQDQMVPVGGTATFVCKSPNLSPNIVWTQGTSVLFVNGARLSDTIPARYRLEDNFTLMITEVEKSDNGMYGCNIVDFGSASATLTVLLPPGPPSITANLAGEIFQEGQNVRFTCASSGGNPTPTIIWMKNGIELPSADPTQTQDGGVTQRTIAVTMDHSDHRANYSCAVYNEVNKGQPLMASRILSVQYSPIITFIPASPYIVRLGEEAELTCQVDANPAVFSVTWEKDGVRLPDASTTQRFSPVERTDAANYTCIASNSISNNPTRGTIKVDVVYAPVVTVGSSQRSVPERTTLTIDCSVDARPEPVEIKWIKVLPSGSRINMPSGQTLQLVQIERDDAGNYTCQARNYLPGQQIEAALGEASVYVHVQYRPGPAQISQVAPINVGQSLQISCTATPEGYPPAKFRWRKNGASQSQENAVYTISQTVLSDNAEYECTPFNEVGDGASAKVNVDIYEPPRLTETLVEEISVRITDTRPLNLTCKGQGRPRPAIEWSKDSVVNLLALPQFYEIVSDYVEKNTYSYEVTSTLYFRGSGREAVPAGGITGLRIEDMGNYTCKTSLNGTLQVYKSTLILTGAGAGDYGLYNCFVSNFLGNVSRTVNVTRKSLPEAPTELQTDNRTWESIHLKWVPGFDGGFPQQFQVYVQEAGSTEPKFPPLQAGSDTSMNITGLWPSTTYEFAVVGRNMLGVGQRSLTLTSHTRKLEIPTLGDATPVFNTANNQLVVAVQPASQYCLRIEAKADGKWETVKACTKLLGGGSMEISSAGVTAINVSVCLVERPEVCGAPTAAVVSKNLETSPERERENGFKAPDCDLKYQPKLRPETTVSAIHVRRGVWVERSSLVTGEPLCRLLSVEEFENPVSGEAFAVPKPFSASVGLLLLRIDTKYYTAVLLKKKKIQEAAWNAFYRPTFSRFTFVDPQWSETGGSNEQLRELRT